MKNISNVIGCIAKRVGGGSEAVEIAKVLLKDWRGLSERQKDRRRKYWQQRLDMQREASGKAKESSPEDGADYIVESMGLDKQQPGKEQMVEVVGVNANGTLFTVRCSDGHTYPCVSHILISFLKYVRYVRIACRSYPLSELSMSLVKAFCDKNEEQATNTGSAVVLDRAVGVTSTASAFIVHTNTGLVWCVWGSVRC